MTVHRQLLIVCSFALLTTACVHTAPTELLDARAAYQRAADNPASKYTPAPLHVAKNSLLVAERSFQNNEDDWLVRGQAYVAMRKAQLAETMGRTEMHQRMLAEAKKREDQAKEALIDKTKAELDKVSDELDDKKAADQMTAQELAAEKQRRAEAERKAALAAAELARIAAVKQDERGMVITLSGSVLFASSKDVLLPDAMTKLNEVADALLAGDPDTTFVVEGHTDSQGSAEKNQDLSLRRAKAVREYLIGREIAPDRITVEAYGETRAIADNSTPEGRANNRRVEIVVKPVTRQG